MRNSTFHLFETLVAVAFAICLNTAAQAADPVHAADRIQSSGRVVRFPAEANLSPGTLMMGKTLVGPARGAVRVPPGQALHLIVTPEGAARLECLTHLKPDDLMAIRMHDVPVDSRALIFVSALPGLMALDLSKTDVDDVQLSIIAKISGLIKLDLSQTLVRGPGLSALAALKNLESLGLSENRLTNDTVSVLVKALPGIKKLDLSRTGISDQGMVLLPRFKNLVKLRLVHTNLTDRALVNLAQIKTLRSLNISDTLVTARGVERFQKALPQCAVELRRKRVN